MAFDPNPLYIYDPFTDSPRPSRRNSHVGASSPPFPLQQQQQQQQGGRRRGGAAAPSSTAATSLPSSASPSSRVNGRRDDDSVTGSSRGRRRRSSRRGSAAARSAEGRTRRGGGGGEEERRGSGGLSIILTTEENKDHVIVDDAGEEESVEEPVRQRTRPAPRSPSNGQPAVEEVRRSRVQPVVRTSPGVKASSRQQRARAERRTQKQQQQQQQQHRREKSLTEELEERLSHPGVHEELEQRRRRVHGVDEEADSQHVSFETPSGSPQKPTATRSARVPKRHRKKVHTYNQRPQQRPQPSTAPHHHHKSSSRTRRKEYVDDYSFQSSGSGASSNSHSRTHSTSHASASTDRATLERLRREVDVLRENASMMRREQQRTGGQVDARTFSSMLARLEMKQRELMLHEMLAAKEAATTSTNWSSPPASQYRSGSSATSPTSSSAMHFSPGRDLDTWQQKSPEERTKIIAQQKRDELDLAVEHLRKKRQQRGENTVALWDMSRVTQEELELRQEVTVREHVIQMEHKSKEIEELKRQLDNAESELDVERRSSDSRRLLMESMGENVSHLAHVIDQNDKLINVLTEQRRDFDRGPPQLSDEDTPTVGQVYNVFPLDSSADQTQSSGVATDDEPTGRVEVEMLSSGAPSAAGSTGVPTYVEEPDSESAASAAGGAGLGLSARARTADSGVQSAPWDAVESGLHFREALERAAIAEHRLQQQERRRRELQQRDHDSSKRVSGSQFRKRALLVVGTLLVLMWITSFLLLDLQRLPHDRALYGNEY